MNARLVTQTNDETGETNLHFLTDPLATIDECVVRGGSWARAKVQVETVTILGDERAIAVLGVREFRCVDNLREGEGSAADPRLLDLDDGVDYP